MSHARRVGNVAALVAVALLAPVPPALAGPPGSEAKQTAARLVDEGVARYDAGDYQAALEKFQAAYEAFASPKIFLNLGEALRKLGRDAEAADAYERFLAETGNAPEVSDAKKRIARDGLEGLRARLGRLRVDADLTTTTLTLDARPWKPVPGRPAYVAAGRHEIVATAPGYLEKRLTVEVSAGQEKQVSLKLEAESGAAQGQVGGPEGALTTAPSGRRRTWTWVAAGAAGVMLLGGIIFGAQASSAYDDFKAGKFGQDPLKYDQMRDDVSTKATAANVLFVGAGLAAATAGVLFYFEGRRPEPTAGTQVNLAAGPGGQLGLAVSGRF